MTANVLETTSQETKDWTPPRTKVELTQVKIAQPKISELSQEELQDLAIKHPRFLAAHRPHLVAKINPEWMGDFYSDWMAMQYPLYMIERKPHWMAYKYPDIVASLSFDVLVTHSPDHAITFYIEKVIDLRPDVMRRYDLIQHDHITGTSKVKRKISLIDRIMSKLGAHKRNVNLANPVVPQEYRE